MQLWATIGKLVLPFAGGIIAAAFFLGGRSRDMADLLKWKADASTRIEQIDNDGTRAGKTGRESGWRELGRYETRLKAVEDSSRKIDTMLLKIEGLEKSLDELKGHPSNRPIKKEQ